MDETTRAIGRLEGRFEGLETTLSDIKKIVSDNASKYDAGMDRMTTIEKDHAKAKGVLVGVSAVSGAAAATVAWAAKKFVGIV
jgi:hypothetical protein